MPADTQEDAVLLAEFKSRLQKGLPKVSDMRSLVRTTVEGKRRLTFNQIILLKGERFLRLDTMGVFGQVLGVFIHEPAKTLLFDPKNNRVLLGESVWESLTRVLGVRIDLRNYTSVFAGRIPNFSQMALRSARLSNDRKRYLLKAESPDGRDHFSIEVDAVSYSPYLLSREGKTGETYRVSWGDYQMVQGVDFPHRLMIEFPDRRESVTLEYKNPILNGGLPVDAFHFPVPQGAANGGAGIFSAGL